MNLGYPGPDNKTMKRDMTIVLKDTIGCYFIYSIDKHYIMTYYHFFFVLKALCNHV